VEKREREREKRARSPERRRVTARARERRSEAQRDLAQEDGLLLPVSLEEGICLGGVVATVLVEYVAVVYLAITEV